MIYLPKPDAESVFEKIEKLIASRIAGEDPSPRIIRWLAEDVGDDLRDRLVKVDLCRPRQSRQMPTIEAFIEGYILKCQDVEPATRKAWRQAKTHLIEFFGADRRLDDITAGDAEDWRMDLIANDYAEASIP